MFAAVPVMFCYGLALKRVISRAMLVLGGIGLLLRLIRPLGARRT